MGIWVMLVVFVYFGDFTPVEVGYLGVLVLGKFLGFRVFAEKKTTAVCYMVSHDVVIYIFVQSNTS